MSKRPINVICFKHRSKSCECWSALPVEGAGRVIDEQNISCVPCPQCFCWEQMEMVIGLEGFLDPIFCVEKKGHSGKHGAILTW